MTPEQLRAASLDGSIESLLEWHPVKAGDFFYSPAGTIHAIGAGVALIEVQQNLDLTYRLYDYGRPRELHLDEGVAATRAVPFRPATKAIELSGAGYCWRKDLPSLLSDGRANAQRRSSPRTGRSGLSPFARVLMLTGMRWSQGPSGLLKGRLA
jgi:mannose-6-phosphate isomerase